MKNKICAAAILFVVPVVSSCQSVELAATPRSITFAQVGTETIGEATAKAQAHCRQYGRDAEFIPDGIADGRATFRCVNG